MSQTSVVFFALLIGFLVYVTVKGELPNYLWILGLGGSAPAAQAGVNLGGIIGGALGGSQ